MDNNSLSTRHHRWLLIYIVLTGAILLAGRELSLAADGRLHAYFLDVGQGDSALLVSPSGKQIVIDGGPDLAALEHLGKHMPFLDRTIELLILSHPNLDHIVALPEILKRYRIERVLITGVAFELPRYQAMLEEIVRQGIEILPVDPAKDIDVGDGLTLDVIWPQANLVGKEMNGKTVNDTSIVLRAMYDDQSILFTGDIEESAERAILASGADTRSNILKVAHHGSKTSSSEEFLRAVDPELAVISVGKDNSYGHPHPSVLDRFKALGVSVKATTEGTVSMTLY